MKKNFYVGLMAAAVLLASCKDETANNKVVGRVLGYKPIYSNDADLFSVQSKPPQNVIKAGKIYALGNYIFQNEIGEGVHITDNSNPANARRIGFIKIKGSEEISIKGNYLYSNNFNDLVVVDISNIGNVAEVNRIRNAFFSSSNLAVPPGHGNFECVDNSKGVVTGWIQDSIDNPKCQN